MSEETTLSKSAWVRLQIFKYENLDFGMLEDLWKKERSNIQGESPVTRQMLSNNRTQILNRYNLDDVSEIPRHRGNPNLSALIKLAFDVSDANVKESEVIEYLGQDGLDCPRNTLHAIRGQMRRKNGANKVPVADDSPDPDQHTGPRARFEGKSKQETPAKVPHQQSGSRIRVLEGLERALEEIVNRCEHIQAGKMADAARRLRRMASAEILTAE